jgi:thiamine-phosphate pyrophosphorylase
MDLRPKRAAPRPAPRLYLLTPLIADAPTFCASLADALSAGDVAAVLLRLVDTDERSLINRAKTLAPIVQDKGAALIVEGHADLVARAGCDGAHLTGIAAFNDALTILKPDRIAGCGGLFSRHDAMAAAEAGADYVMFGEPADTGARPSFAAVEERVAWWAEIFEAPCVGYAAERDEVAPLVKAGADFIALGDWLWREPYQIAALLSDIEPLLRLPETTA